MGMIWWSVRESKAVPLTLALSRKGRGNKKKRRVGSPSYQPGAVSQAARVSGTFARHQSIQWDTARRPKVPDTLAMRRTILPVVVPVDWVERPAWVFDRFHGGKQIVWQTEVARQTRACLCAISTRVGLRSVPRRQANCLANRSGTPDPRLSLRDLDPPYGCFLDIVVQAELVGVRAQPHGVHLVLRLVPDPGVDHVGREHVAAEQELVVAPASAASASSSEPGVLGTSASSSGARS